MTIARFTTEELSATTIGNSQGRLNAVVDEVNALSAAMGGATNPFNFAGTIATAADFPTPASVAIGDVFVVTDDVVDNDGTKTNTGLNFLAKSKITWDGTTWQDDDERESGIASVAVTPYTIPDGIDTVVVDTTTIAGPSVVNLPPLSAARKGRIITVIDGGSGALAFPIAITPDGTDEIDNVNAAKSIAINDGAITVQTEGVEWYTNGATAHALGDGSDHSLVASSLQPSSFGGAALGRLVRTGVGTYAVIQDNFAAATAPIVTSDSAAGYQVGSLWIDTTAHPRQTYVCVDASVGAAIWREIVQQSNLAGTVPPGAGNDSSEGYGVGSLWIDIVAAPRNIYVCVNSQAGNAVWRRLAQQSNLAGGAPPGVGDDNTTGYGIGSLWVEVVSVPPNVYICVSAATGAAVWRHLAQQSNLAAAVAPIGTDDAAAGYGVGSLWIDTTADLVYICVDAAPTAAVWQICLNTVAAGGELAGTYPDPTVADGVLDAANAQAGNIPGLVVDKGLPSSVVVAFDNAGVAARPADGATYAFSVGGALIATLTAADAPVGEDDFQRSSAGVEEDDTILMATAFAAAVNAHSVLGLRVEAAVYGGAGDGRWYVECRNLLQSSITTGEVVTCATGGGTPGVVIDRAVQLLASKRQLYPFRYTVDAQDVLAGEIRFTFGCTDIVSYGLDVLNGPADYTRIAWSGAVDTAAGRLTIDNSGGVDWAAGNVIVGWLIGNVS